MYLKRALCCKLIRGSDHGQTQCKNKGSLTSPATGIESLPKKMLSTTSSRKIKKLINDYKLEVEEANELLKILVRTA